MRRLLLLPLVLSATMSFGQSQNSFTSSFDSKAAVDGPSSMSAPGPRRAPFGSLTESFVYVDSPHYYGADRGLMGWSVVPEVNLVHHIGLQADFASLYM